MLLPVSAASWHCFCATDDRVWDRILTPLLLFHAQKAGMSVQDCPIITMFATTERLNLRGFVESDTERLLEMYNDPRVARTATLGYVRPLVGKKGKDFIDAVHGALFHIIIERKVDPAAATNEKESDDAWIGHLSIFGGEGKNRDGGFGISITPKWWGHGFATEATNWTVGYAFEQLGLHRVSLGLVAHNERALRVYTKWYDTVTSLGRASDFVLTSVRNLAASSKRGERGVVSGRMESGWT